MLLLRAQLVLWRTQRRLRRAPHGRILSLVHASAAPVLAGPPEPEALVVARAVERAVVRAATHGPVRFLCLARAIALHEMLESRGLAGSRVVVGVQLGDGFDAHAWVDYRGVVLGDTRSRVSRYVPLAAAQVSPAR
jgi:hypothetical protein